jgi:hypothetical protein
VTLVVTAHVNEHMTCVAIYLAHDSDLTPFLVQILLIYTYQIGPNIARSVWLTNPLKYPKKVCCERQHFPVTDNFAISEIASPNI